jgi:hypothetical protein
VANAGFYSCALQLKFLLALLEPTHLLVLLEPLLRCLVDLGESRVERHEAVMFLLFEVLQHMQERNKQEIGIRYYSQVSSSSDMLCSGNSTSLA